MVTDQQVRRLRHLDLLGLSRGQSAAKAGMDEKTARKYRRLGKLPGEMRRMDREYRTRPDPFAEAWPELEAQLRLNPGLEAKTLFADLQRRFPGRFGDGQLRTFQRRVRQWRALAGPPKEVFFAQVHEPGRLAASDFTHCSELRVTIAGAPLEHLIYHFVLTYSNWETGTICFAESYESLSEGLQNALWELGGVPQLHRTDRLTAAIPPGTEGSAAFTQRYQALLRHYGLKGQAIQAGHANENGDVEQSHRQFKRALEQSLLLRGSRDFSNRPEYEAFLRRLFEQLNAGRRQAAGGRTASITAATGSPSRVVSASVGACRQRQHDSPAWQHLFGIEPLDRRTRRGPAVRGESGSVVRGTSVGIAAAAARPGQAPDRIPSRDRLAGAQAGGLCGLSLSSGSVSVEHVPAGL